MNKELTIEALVKKNKDVISFVDDELARLEVPNSVRVEMVTVAEEIFLNIANYAYEDGQGDATVRMEIDEDKRTITLSFIDSGKEFDPLAKEDPDIYLPIEERPIGGLGILMVKKMMDSVSYYREDDKNHLTVTKKWA
ncbi:MAG: ATP-binding protein [Lachnospiraceae bacterium]|nr:ATP-binding protein [Lachnospiraceae bacterium]